MGISLSGYDRVHARLQRLINGPMQQDLAKIGNIGVAGIKSNLEGNPLGLKDILPATKAAKGSSQILVDTARMKNSVFFRITAKAVELVTRDFKAAFMHFGTKHVPQRKWFVLRKDVIAQMLPIMQEFLRR